MKYREKEKFSIYFFVAKTNFCLRIITCIIRRNRLSNCQTVTSNHVALMNTIDEDRKLFLTKNYVIGKGKFLLYLGWSEKRLKLQWTAMKINEDTFSCQKKAGRNFYDTKIQYPNKHGHNIRYGNHWTFFMVAAKINFFSLLKWH